MDKQNSRILYLSRAMVEDSGVTMRQVVDAVDEGFRQKGLGKCEMPAKIGVHSAPDSFLHAMPAYIEGADVIGMKWVGGYPANAKQGLPYITGLLVLNDTRTGLPLAIMDCAWITAMRTGASVAVAAKYMANADSATAGFFGCGVQARTSLRALMEVLDLREVRCADAFPAAAQRFAEEMRELFPQVHFTLCDAPRQVTENADIVVSAIPIITDPHPVLEADWLKAGGLAVSLDFDSAWTAQAMQQCTFVTDDKNQLQEIKANGVYFKDIPQNVYADLGELASGTVPGRRDDKERFFSMNMGIAIDDMMTAQLIYKQARERSLGIWLEL